MALALFRRRKPAPPVITGPPEDPMWVKSDTGKYFRLIRLDPEKQGLTGKSGVTVIWHAGIRPAWVYVGYTNDLAGHLYEIGGNREIMDYEVNGGLFVTWSLIRDEYQPGVVRYLTTYLKPLVRNPDISRITEDPVPVLAPSRRT